MEEHRKEKNVHPRHLRTNVKNSFAEKNKFTFKLFQTSQFTHQNIHLLKMYVVKLTLQEIISKPTELFQNFGKNVFNNPST